MYNVLVPDESGMPLGLLLRSPRDEAPHKEDDNGANDSADEAGAFAGPIPSHRLPEIARHERSHDAENCRQYETRGLVFARHDEFGNYACYKPNDDRPDDTHGLLPIRDSVMPELPRNHTP